MLPAIFLSLCTIWSVALAQTVNPDQCTPPNAVHAILGRGESAEPNNPDTLNVLGTLLDMITARIPGSNGLGLAYQYSNEDKMAAVYDGASQFITHIQDYVRSCPSSKIVLVGYSMGAMAMMDALCGTSSFGQYPHQPIDQSYAPYIFGAITHGDEGHVPFQPYNVGNCTNGVGIFPRLMPLTCAPYYSALRSYCDQYDEQCCGAFPNNGNQGHHGYTERYNADTVDWLRIKLGLGPWTGA